MNKYDRIDKIRLELGLSKTKFSERLGFPFPQNYGSFLKKGELLDKGEDATFTDDKLEALLKEFNVNLNWIYTGIGPKFNSNDNEIEDEASEMVVLHQAGLLDKMKRKINELQAKLSKYED